MSDGPRTGMIVWQDLTVDDAPQLRDFYRAVVGWTSEGEDMGGYEDYNMVSPTNGETAAGICHARGSNAGVPPQWLVYIQVESVDAATQTCLALGGTVVDGPREMGNGRVAIIRDPAGAVCALWQPA